MKLENKAIVVTGATSGIGLGLLKRLVKIEGARVAAVGRDPDKLKNLAHEYGVYTILCDQKDDHQIEEMLKTLQEEHPHWPGRVDIFFANAGFAYYEEFNGDWSHVEDIYKVNVVAPLSILGALAKTGRRVQVVITTSGLARVPIPGYSLYSSTKSALDGFCRAYQHEKPKGVTLTAVYPVAVRTNFYRNSPDRMPVPLLRQSLNNSVTRILWGTRLNLPYIYPSLIYTLFLLLRRVLPIAPVYVLLERLRFRWWQRNG